MAAISFVVVSTPRSGTGYTARLLSSMGIPCGHESYFSFDHQIADDGSRETFGDSSWLAAPFLAGLPEETVILHQVRDPIRRSIP